MRRRLASIALKISTAIHRERTCAFNYTRVGERMRKPGEEGREDMPCASRCHNRYSTFNAKDNRELTKGREGGENAFVNETVV